MKGLNINKVEFKADHKVELEYYENQNLKTFQSYCLKTLHLMKSNFSSFISDQMVLTHDYVNVSSDYSYASSELETELDKIDKMLSCDFFRKALAVHD